jgi:conjugal transfer/entry exclusion protein
MHRRLNRQNLARRAKVLRGLAGFSVVVLLVQPRLASAQFGFFGPGEPVYDAANHIQNTISAVQAVLMVANQILELTPLEEIIALEGFVEDIQTLRDLIGQLRGLGWDMNSLDGQFERLFGLEGLPETSAGMAEWQTEVNTIALETRHDAMRVQTLVRTLLRTVDHLIGLMESVAHMIGNLQISQTISQAQQKVAQLLSEGQLTRTVHERAESFQGASDVAETEMLRKINRNIWKSWPGMAE